MFSFNPLVKVAAIVCLLSPALQADNPTADGTPPAPNSASAPQIVIEKDGATGEDRLYLIDPQGQKRLLQTVPQGRGSRGWHPAPITEDYFQAINSFAAGERYIIGVELQPIPPGLHSKLGIDGTYGLVVVQVVPEKPAAQAGVQQFDLLLKINGNPVTQPGDVVRIVNEAKGSPLALTILRDKTSLEVSVTPMEAKGVDFPAVPPGMRFVGPGMIVNPGGGLPDLRSMQSQLEALRQEMQELHKRMDQLTEQLQKSLPAAPSLEAPKND